MVSLIETRSLHDALPIATTTVKELVALRLGEPLSVTMVVNVLVLGPWASVGVQVMMPLAEMLALVTTPAALVTDKAYARLFAGMSESVAVLVTVNVVNSLIV